MPAFRADLRVPENQVTHMMTERTTFDCVEMKNRIQAELMLEYESRKGEFPSYADFIVATAAESDEIRAWRERIAKARATAS